MAEKYVRERMAIVFNVWAERYADNPDEFSKCLGDDGRPVSDYGQKCAVYFEKLAGELDTEGKLPLPPTLISEPDSTATEPAA